MKTRLSLIVALLAAGLMAGPAESQTAGAGGKGKMDVTIVYMEVELLQHLADLELTPAQLDFLAAIAKDTADKPRDRKAPKTSAEFRKTLTALHAALKVNDTDQVDDLHDKLDELMEKEEIVFDDEVNLTDAARKKSVEFLRQLRVGRGRLARQPGVQREGLDRRTRRRRQEDRAHLRRDQPGE
jgi:hypothetical protein